jgi:putative flippase GtrA
MVLNARERTRFLRFMIVGAIGAVVDFGIMNLCTRLFNLPLTIAGTISFISAVISNFLWNRFWTYPDSRSKPIAKQLVMFFAVNTAGLLIRLPILHFLEPFLNKNLPDISFLQGVDIDLVSKNLTLLIAVGVVLLWNYFVNRYWTYNDIDKG